MKDVTITIDGETHKLVYTESNGTSVAESVCKYATGVCTFKR